MTSQPSPCMVGVIPVDASVDDDRGEPDDDDDDDDEDDDDDDVSWLSDDGEGMTRNPGTNPVNPPVDAF